MDEIRKRNDATIQGGTEMTTVTLIWFIVLTIGLFVVYRRAEEGRALQWRLEEFRRDLETVKRDVGDVRKKVGRESLTA